ncbi:MAG: DMT family transporter [Mangrovibacterium sp.]
MQNRHFLQSTNFLGFVACLLWSTAFVGIKIGMNYHTPIPFAGVRFALAGFFLFLYYGNKKEYFAQVRQNWRFLVLMTFVQTVLQYVFFYTGINMLPASIAALIVGASPLFAAVLSHLLMSNDKMTLRKLLSLLIGFVGVAIISFAKESHDSSERVSILGVFILLLNGLVAGYSNVLVAKNKSDLNPIVLGSSTLFSGGVLLALGSWVVQGNTLTNPTPEYWIALLWLSSLSAVAFAIWYSLLRRPTVKVSELNMWKFVVPVGGAILSWLILPEEKPQWAAIVGMLLIALSLLTQGGVGLARLFGKK